MIHAELFQIIDGANFKGGDDSATATKKAMQLIKLKLETEALKYKAGYLFPYDEWNELWKGSE